LECSFKEEKKEKTYVFTQFNDDITKLDRHASRHRRDIEKVDSKVDKMAKWEEKCQILTNDLLARVQILEERDTDKNRQILELTEKVLELKGRVELMSDQLCHCARSAEVDVGDGSAEAPFKLEYADEEGSGSSDRSNTLSLVKFRSRSGVFFGSLKTCPNRQVLPSGLALVPTIQLMSSSLLALLPICRLRTQ